MHSSEFLHLKDTLTRLKQTMPAAALKPEHKAKRVEPAPQATKPLTRAEFDQRLLALALLTVLGIHKISEIAVNSNRIG
jgi:hypothetical protein